MCGFLGITGARARHEIELSLNLIRHRGPDDGGVFADDFVTLGHRRLAIIDIANGKQP